MYRIGQASNETQRGTWTRYWPFGSTAFGIIVGGTAGHLLARKIFASAPTGQRIAAELAFDVVGWQAAKALYDHDYNALREGPH